MAFNRSDHHCISWTSLISVGIRDGCSREIVLSVRTCRTNYDKDLQRKDYPDVHQYVKGYTNLREYKKSCRVHIDPYDIVDRDTTCEYLIDRKENVTECLSMSIPWQIETQKILSSSVETNMTERARRLGTRNILAKWKRKDTFRVRLRELQEHRSWRGWWNKEGEGQGQWRRRTTSLLLGR